MAIYNFSATGRSRCTAPAAALQSDSARRRCSQPLRSDFGWLELLQVIGQARACGVGQWKWEFHPNFFLPPPSFPGAALEKVPVVANLYRCLVSGIWKPNGNPLLQRSHLQEGLEPAPHAVLMENFHFTAEHVKFIPEGP